MQSLRLPVGVDEPGEYDTAQMTDRPPSGKLPQSDQPATTQPTLTEGDGDEYEPGTPTARGGDALTQNRASNRLKAIRTSSRRR